MCLFISGYFGNIATLVVLKFEKGLRSFTKVMLCMETFWDIMYLTFPGMSIFYNILTNVDTENNIFYISNIGHFLAQPITKCSIWHLSLISLERMCLVVWPSNLTFRSASCREAFIVSFFITLVAFCLNMFSHFLKTKNPYILTAFLVIVFRVIIPFIIISSSTLVLHYKMQMDTKRIRPNAHIQIHQRTLLPIKMVLIISSYYFITTVTVYVINSTRKNHMFREPSSDYYERTMANILGIFITSTYSIKFYLYTISIPHIRKGFINICKRILNKLMKNENVQIESIFSVDYTTQR